MQSHSTHSVQDVDVVLTLSPSRSVLAIDKDKKRKYLRERTRCEANPTGTNDMDYEDKQKTQDSSRVYEGLFFDLAAEISRETSFILRPPPL